MSRAYHDHIDALAHFPLPPCEGCGRPDCTCPVLDETPCAADCCVCDLSEPVLDAGPAAGGEG